ncbi:MAG: hypothetical protein JSR30_00005 [Proteobacteria bacterium]|nr:hypothetical protein [Pseudomonadota bacterium]
MAIIEGTKAPIPQNEKPMVRPHSPLLTTCRACDSLVARDAYNCPKCGKRMNITPTDLTARVIFWLIVVSVAGTVLGTLLHI